MRTSEIHNFGLSESLWKNIYTVENIEKESFYFRRGINKNALFI